MHKGVTDICIYNFMVSCTIYLIAGIPITDRVVFRRVEMVYGVTLRRKERKFVPKYKV